MSELTTAPSEQPAPETAPVQTPGAQPAATDHSESYQNLDKQSLGDLLFGEKKEPTETVPTPPAAPEVIPAAEVTPETPPANGEQPPATETPESSKTISRHRISVSGVEQDDVKEMARIAEMLRTGEASSTRDAMQKLYGSVTPATGEQPAAETAPATPAATPQAPATVADLQATIDQLRAERDLADDDFNKPEARRLTALIEDTVGLLAEARIAAVSTQHEARSYQQRYVESVDAFEAKYDWATDEASPLYELLDNKIEAAKSRQDPALNDPGYILKFADDIAERFGKPATIAKPPAPPAAPARIVGGGVAPGHSEAHQLTEIEQRALLNSASKEDLAGALWG